MLPGRSQTVGRGRSPSFSLSMTRWPGTYLYYLFLFISKARKMFSFLIWPLAGMRWLRCETRRWRQQPPCSTMVLNRFSCMFDNKYLQPDFKVITNLPIRREVTWKHGTSFPGTHATIRRFIWDKLEEERGIYSLQNAGGHSCNLKMLTHVTLHNNQ